MVTHVHRNRLPARSVSWPVNRWPDTISHEALLAALECQQRDLLPRTTLYYTQLKHRLLTLARKARLEVAAYELTGLPPAELCSKSSMELLGLLDGQKGLQPGDREFFGR
jgi:hypothetical protein